MNEKGKLSDEKIANTDPAECFVRFSVDGKKLWKDESLYQAYIAYACGDCTTSDICYATGEHGGITYKHPSKIRHTGDKAKLFSANDESGFSYRGRFADKTQATAISFDYSQKLHNALKCLIKKQGFIVDGLCILVWENHLEDIQKPFDRCSFDDDDDLDDYIPESHTGEINKTLTISSIMGAKNQYKSDSKTLLLMFDSATTGRLSMTEYAELATSDYLSNLEKWHRDTAWRCYGKEKSFSVFDIANCAYGREQSNMLSCDTKKDVFQRLIPCIVCGDRLPSDIANSLFIRACKPASFTENNWRKILYCACGMIRKKIIETKGECTMSLDKESHSRDYLYGRLLAVADVAEASTYTKEESRPTNAKRFFEAFSNHPYQTWDILYKSLRPYLDRMNRGGSIYYERIINEITAMFEHDEFNNNSPLSPEFLHAYSCQVNELYTKKTNDNQEEE